MNLIPDSPHFRQEDRRFRISDGILQSVQRSDTASMERRDPSTRKASRTLISDRACTNQVVFRNLNGPSLAILRSCIPFDGNPTLLATVDAAHHHAILLSPWVKGSVQHFSPRRDAARCP